LKLNLKNILAN